MPLMLRWGIAVVLPLLLVLVMGPRVIPLLHKLKFGQAIYNLGPQTHKNKEGTPVMGGLMMAAAVLVTALVTHAGPWQGGWDATLALLLVSFLSMAVGFADDFVKVWKKRHEGLTPWQKIAGQVFVAAGFSVYCYFHPQIGPAIRVPFTALEWNLGWWYIPVMTLVVIFMINSANLQDGLDGLLSTVSSAGDCGWAALAVLAAIAAGGAAEMQLNIASFALAMAGAAFGFLRFNRFPAKVFMGDTGSMLIGGATVGMAMLLRQPLLLLLISFPMVMSSVSVILQVGYFKLTKKLYGEGRRIFRMSPIHHHFELCGYSETQIVAMYLTVTAVGTLIAVLSEAARLIG